MINIGIIGTGYVGLVTGTCLAGNKNNIVTCLDIDKEKIAKLNNGEVPIYEQDLQELIKRKMTAWKLFFQDNIDEVIDTFEVIFIAVGTPSNIDGSVDLSYVEAVCQKIKDFSTKPKTIVMKSTVPVGTYRKLIHLLGSSHTVISNPEFLREGTAVHDFLKGDRIIIGTPDGNENEVMAQIYEEQSAKIIWMDNASAEMTKYASNCMLASKLALWNEIAVLCDNLGANIHEVRRGVGSDTRIGPRFLLAGPGYGGSCFPKDTRGLLQMFRDMSGGLDIVYGNLIDAVIKSNDNHKQAPYFILKDAIEGLDIKKIAILGLAFKGMTDDVRESPTLTLLHMLDKDSIRYEIVVADPIAKTFPDLVHQVTYTTDHIKALKDADVVITMTEWPEYKGFYIDYLKSLMRGNIIIDARNIWDRYECIKCGFVYRSIGNG